MVIEHQDQVQGGKLEWLQVDQLRASQTNPRKLFDERPLDALRRSIRTHGVLVPLTVYKLPGQDLYGIIDGERRFRCCKEIAEDDPDVRIPANIVAPPNEMAHLIYMFNIHQFREQWELMPTAIALKTVIEYLGTEETTTISEVTGLRAKQIERCRLILSFPEKYQALSMDGDPSQRIPSNFWVELHPVLELIEEILPDLFDEKGRDGLIDDMLVRYGTKKIKSVIHFRKILEANEVQENAESNEEFVDQLREYLRSTDLEIKEVFDRFIVDTQRVNKVVTASRVFLRAVEAARMSYASERREDLIASLREVLDYVGELLEKLEGEDPPNR